MLFIVSAFVLGLVIGSFLNVVILRLPPLMEYTWKKDYAEFTEAKFEEPAPPGIGLDRSHCPKCKNKLRWYHNIPLISYISLRGKCSFCGQPISIRYPFIELLTGVLSALMAYLYGVELQFVAAVILVCFLITITWIDIDTFLIPDQISLSLLWFGLFFSLFEFSIPPSVAIIGALVGYLSLWSVFHLFKLITGKEGMGYGDFKLLAAGGAWLGYEQLIIVLMLSSVSGLIIAVIEKLMGKTENKIPFGPYLSIGILVAYLAGDIIMDHFFTIA
ncbi:MAG: prepilin peptidase [Xanthomonadales bacterium]|nr:prepilin peptidase [Xanthomonadales bacterium]